MPKKIIRKLVTIFQKTIMGVLLFIVYYLIFGLTVAIAFLFNRKMFTGENGLLDSSWIEATGYEADTLNSKRQS